MNLGRTRRPTYPGSRQMSFQLMDRTAYKESASAEKARFTFRKA